jgi:hypothetical protein
LFVFFRTMRLFVTDSRSARWILICLKDIMSASTTDKFCCSYPGRDRHA